MSVIEVAKKLAKAHRENDEELEAIYWVPDENEIRLVEVTGGIPTTFEVMPFGFAPQGDIIYRSVIVLLSREELNAVKAGQLQLPASWGPDAHKRLEPLS